jgi:hypothetical protein
MKQTLFSVILVALTILSAHPSAAEGALAVGSTGNVAKDGIAVGWAIDYATRQIASEAALASCHKFQAPKAAANCEIVGAITRQCGAIAFDPKQNTPGAGWAIAATKEEAESQALANCRATAGASRRQFCQIDTTKCDTKD